MEGYIDQSPDNLRLSIVDGNLDRTQFLLLANQAKEMAGVQVSATVIGASHLITYTTDDGLELNEVFACVPVRDTGDAYHLDAFSNGPIHRTVSGFDYTFGTWKVPWLTSEPRTLIDLESRAHRAAESRRDIGVVQEFPMGDLTVTPKTVITGTVTDGAIVMTTAHSYPNVPALRLSRSTLSRTRLKK